MNKQEFYEKHKELLDKSEFKLISYFNFTFSFSATVDEYVISVCSGGNSDDIYKDNWNVFNEYSWNQIEPISGIITADVSEKIIDEFYD